MIVELMIVGQALQNFLRKESGFVSPFRQAPNARSKTCPTKPSAIYDIELSEVPMFKDLGLLIPTTPTGNGVTPTPATTGWEVLTGQGVRDVTYTVDVDLADVEAFRFQEEIKKALR